MLDPDEQIKEPEKSYRTASLWSKLMFSWAYNSIEKVNKGHKLRVQDLGTLPASMSIQNKLIELERHFSNSERPSLIRSSLYTHRWELALCITFSFINTGLDLIIPMLIKQIMSYLQHQDPDTSKGFLIMLGLVVTKQLQTFLSMHCFFIQFMIGEISTDALRALIYSKLLKVSPSTNKHFESGQIVNMI